MRAIEPLPQGTTLAEYRIEAVLGSGTFGALCYKGRLDKRKGQQEYHDAGDNITVGTR